MVVENVPRATRAEACERLRGRDFFRGRFAEALWLIRNSLFQFVCVEEHGETTTVEAERCCCKQETQHLRRAVANSKPRRPKQPADFVEGLRKVRGRFAEAPRKGGSVFAGKCTCSTGSPMEPKPTQAAANHVAFLTCSN